MSSDAGYMKFGYSMASTATLLLWGMLEFEDGYRAAGEWDNVRNNLRWVLEYLLKCHTNDTVLFAQVSMIQGVGQEQPEMGAGVPPEVPHQ